VKDKFYEELQDVLNDTAGYDIAPHWGGGAVGSFWGQGTNFGEKQLHTVLCISKK